jgi:hypothetical protein
VPERQVVAWFASSHPGHFQPSSFPVFVMQDSGGYYYGFPEWGTPGGWLAPRLGCEAVEPAATCRLCRLLLLLLLLLALATAQL